MYSIHPYLRSPLHCVKCLVRRSKGRKGHWNETSISDVRIVTASSYATSCQAARRSEWVQPEGNNTGIYIYNSLTRRKDELILPKGKHLSWYICGPTVYDKSHIGHASNYVRYDIIRRILNNFCDLNVLYMMGITDVDDKIINKANLMQQEFTVLTSHYEREFFQEMQGLNVLQPVIVSRVTDCIPDIVNFVQGIMDRGHAYKAADNSVYFDVKAYGRYHQFSGTAENQGDPGVKKNVEDFALWKAVKPGEPYWQSPWGPGRPGWHIECSTIASRVFGKSVDIHSGGVDLMFPHHENELAQSCSFHNTNQWVNYWTHTGFLHLHQDVNKMSKSLKNFIPTSELLKNYTANQFRMFCMLTHYRNNIEFTDEKMQQAVVLDNQIGNFLRLCESYVKGQHQGGNIPEAETMQMIAEMEEKAVTLVKDDFRTPEVMKLVFSVIHKMNANLSKTDGETRSPGTVAAVSVSVKRLCKKLGFHKKGWRMSQNPDNMKLKEVLDNTVNFRWKVRNYALNMPLTMPETMPKKEQKSERMKLIGPLLQFSDDLRSQLNNCNINIQDQKTYSSWEFADSGFESEDSPWEGSDTERPKHSNVATGYSSGLAEYTPSSTFMDKPTSDKSVSDKPNSDSIMSDFSGGSNGNRS